MTISEAYDKTIETIEELKLAGVQCIVERNTSRQKVEDISLPRAKWLSVRIQPEDQAQVDLVYEKKTTFPALEFILMVVAVLEKWNGNWTGRFT